MQHRLLFFLIFNTCCFTTQAQAEERNGPTYTLTSLWENKYISEGRDNLGNGGLASIEGSAEWDNFSAAIWYGVGTRATYDELNISLEYALAMGGIDAYLGYTRLDFFKDDEKDNEFGLGLVLNNVFPVTPALDYVYSTEANGAFVEFSLSSEFNMCEDKLTIEPYILQGLDYGYASAGHDGKNHVQAGVDFSLSLSTTTQLVGSVAHSWAQKDVENDKQDDESWASIGLSTSF